MTHTEALNTPEASALAELTRPIIGIENRTAQEAFDIMADRFRGFLRTPPTSPSEEAVEALREARTALALGAGVPLADPFIVVELRALCERAGYGNVMKSASALWRERLERDGLAGGEFISGPCRTTAEKAIARADAIFSAPPVTAPDEKGEAWRPIESAPRDGTRILVWATTRPPHYDDQAYIETVLQGEHVEEVQPACWHEDDGEWELHYIGTPLFWMPLPPPPNPTTAKEADDA